MEQRLFLLLLSFAIFHSTTGLKCYQCLNYRTDSSTLNAALKTAGLQDEDCLPEKVDITKLKTVECEGLCASCTKFTGNITARYLQITDVMIHVTGRGCVSNGAREDTCETETSSGLSEPVTSISGFTVKNATATACVCSSDNCNGGTSASLSHFSVLLSILLSLLYLG